jgi:hypothetical protein
LNRRGGTNLQDEYSNNWEFADFLWGSPGNIYCRSYKWNEHFDPASPIHLDISYLIGFNKRNQKNWVLQRNDTFKFKITLDLHHASRKLIYCLLPDPPYFSLPSTFKVEKSIYELFVFGCVISGLSAVVKNSIKNFTVLPERIPFFRTTILTVAQSVSALERQPSAHRRGTWPRAWYA